MKDIRKVLHLNPTYRTEIEENFEKQEDPKLRHTESLRRDWTVDSNHWEFSCIQLDPKGRPFGSAFQIGEPKTSTLFPLRITLEKGMYGKQSFQTATRAERAQSACHLSRVLLGSWYQLDTWYMFSKDFLKGTLKYLQGQNFQEVIFLHLPFKA